MIEGVVVLQRDEAALLDAYMVRLEEVGLDGDGRKGVANLTFLR